MQKFFTLLSVLIFSATQIIHCQTFHFVDGQQFDTTGIPKSYTIPEKMNWWYEARFGMFIHFGSYSYYGHGEWCMFLENWSKQDYQEKITKNFNPKNFNAKKIVDLAKTAGMKYIIITAKHHEGFSMWNTQVDDFKDYTNTTTYDLYHYLGFERDILMELKNECDKQGIKFGLYYSILDWNHHSQYHKDYWSQLYSMDEKTPFIESEKKQIKELIDRYHPSILWFDGDWCENKDTADVFNWWTKQDAIDLYDYIMSIDSNIIVNERIKRNLGLGDFMCPEEKIPPMPLPRPWETCMTMNGAWGFDSKKCDYTNYEKPEFLFQKLFMIASRDGNFLLNIGLEGDGKIPKNDSYTLRKIGKFMEIYGDAIYGTTRDPIVEKKTHNSMGEYLFTQKKDKIYWFIPQPINWTYHSPQIKTNYTNEDSLFTNLKTYELSKPNKYITPRPLVINHNTDKSLSVSFSINYQTKGLRTYTNKPNKTNIRTRRPFEIIVIELPKKD